jgi:hypothetical protein
MMHGESNIKKLIFLFYLLYSPDIIACICCLDVRKVMTFLFYWSVDKFTSHYVINWLYFVCRISIDNNFVLLSLSVLFLLALNKMNKEGGEWKRHGIWLVCMTYTWLNDHLINHSARNFITIGSHFIWRLR